MFSTSFLQYDKKNNKKKKKLSSKVVHYFRLTFVAISLLESLLIRVSRKESLDIRLLSLTKSKQSAYPEEMKVILSQHSSKLIICQITLQKKNLKLNSTGLSPARSYSPRCYLFNIYNILNIKFLKYKILDLKYFTSRVSRRVIER